MKIPAQFTNDFTYRLSLPDQRNLTLTINNVFDADWREAQFAALRKAALANVTINPIDPGGIRPCCDNTQDPTSSFSYLRTMAESTGGRVIISQKIPSTAAKAGKPKANQVRNSR